MENVSKMDREAGVRAQTARVSADIGTVQCSIALNPRSFSESKHLKEHTAETKEKRGRKALYMDR